MGKSFKKNAYSFVCLYSSPRNKNPKYVGGLNKIKTTNLFRKGINTTLWNF